MKYKQYEKKVYLLFFISFSYVISFYSQSKDYNYVILILKHFLCHYHTPIIISLNAYNLSILDLSHRLSDVFNYGEFNKPYEIGDLQLLLKFFTKDNVGMLILQPGYNDPNKDVFCLPMAMGKVLLQ